MIYLDNSATTKPCAEAVEAMVSAMTENWGNPSALYNFGIDTAKHNTCPFCGATYTNNPEYLENLKRETRRYAKRQLSYWGRDKEIKWLEI